MEFENSAITNSNINISKTINKDTFIELIQENKISLYRLSKSILKNEADVEDAISETILKSYTNIHKLKAQESFKAWLMKILVNECYSIIKKNKRIQLEEDFTIYEGVHEVTDGDNLMPYINKLEDTFKAVVILFYYEDLSIKSIGKILKVPEGTVKSRLRRAKLKLKDMMETNYKEGVL